MRKQIRDPLTGALTNAGGRDSSSGALVDNQLRGSTTGALQTPTGATRVMGDRDPNTGAYLNNGVRDSVTGQYRTPGTASTDPLELLPVGTVGAVGSPYEGYTLAYVQTFDGTLADALIRPGNPFGWLANNFSERDRRLTSVNSCFSLGDLFWTGDRDANDGLAISSFSDVLTMSGGVISMKCRQATTQEKALLGTRSAATGPNTTERTMVGSHPSMFPAFDASNDRIVEMRRRYSNGGVPYTDLGGNPIMATWSLTRPGGSEQGNSPGAGWNDEMDREEYHLSAGQAETRYSAIGTDTKTNWGSTYDNTWNILRQVISASATVQSAWDDNFNQLGTGKSLINSAANLAVAFYEVFGVGVQQVSQFDNTTPFDVTHWNGKFHQLDVSSIRVWVKTGNTNYASLVPDATVWMDYGGQATYALPSQTALWGGAVTSETIRGIQAYDTNGPGRTSQFVASMETRGTLPVGVTNNSRVLSFATTFSNQAGICHMSVTPVTATVGVTQPHRIAVYVKPKLQIPKLGLCTAGSPFSYQLTRANAGIRYWDNGNCPQGSHSGLTLVSGPNWLSFDSATYTLSGNCPANFTPTFLTFRCTNGAGLYAEQQILLTNVATFEPADLTGLVEAWCSTDPYCVPDDGNGKVALVRHMYDGTKNLGQKTSANRPTIIINGGPDGARRVIRITSGTYLGTPDGANNSTIFGLWNAASNIQTSIGYACFAYKANATGLQRICGHYNVAGDANFTFRHAAAGTNDRGISYASLGQSTATVAENSAQDTNWHIVEIIKNGSALSYTIDGVQKGSATISQTASLVETQFLIGAAISASSLTAVSSLDFGGRLAYNTIPDSTGQSNCRQWLASRLGITTA